MAESGSGALRFAYKGSRLKPLRAFCQVARLGSVSRAAEALYLSQPAVTLQLQALERELGVRLLERSGRRLTPTREGELLYEMARPLVEGLDNLAAHFREQVRGLDAGELNVAAGSSTILYLLPGIVDAFRRSHPDVRLTLHNVTGASGLDLLRSDGVDLAVGSMLDVPADLTYAPVYRFEPMLIMPPDHPLAAKRTLRWRDLRAHALVTAGRDHERSVAQMRLSAPQEQRVTPVDVVDHISTAMGIAAQGLAATLAPVTLCRVRRKWGWRSRKASTMPGSR